MSLQQLRQLFAMESEETLLQMEDALLQLEKEPDNLDTIKTVFRHAHTIKGSAGVVGLEDLSSFTHVMENALDRLRSQELSADSEFVRLLLRCRDYLVNSLQSAVAEEESNPDLEQERAYLLERLQICVDAPAGGTVPSAAEEGGAAKTSAEEAVSVSTVESPEKAPSAPLETAPPAEEEDSLETPGDSLHDLFVKETGTTLKQMQQLLRQVKSGFDNTQINQILLSATRNIVTSAKVVDFLPVSEFAAELEKILIALNQGEFSPSQSFSAKAVEACAHIGDLIKEYAANGTISGELAQSGETLLATLLDITENADAAAETQAPTAEPPSVEEAPAVEAAEENTAEDMREANSMPTHHTTPVTEDEEQTVVAETWHISLRFTEDALQQGVDPLASLRYLNSYGEVASLYTLLDAMPADIEDIDPEKCYLGFEVEYKTDADKETIESLFELLLDYCKVRILPPHSRLSYYIQLIQDLPEDTMRLGEILVEIGSLTERELQAGLDLQQAVVKQSNEAPPIGQILVNSGVVEQTVVDAALDKQRQQTGTQPQQPTGGGRQQSVERSRLQKTLNVDADKLDQLINLVGELVIANAGVNLQMQEVQQEHLKEAVSLMSRLVEEIRNSTLRMRMVHIGGTFNRFRRLVHDLSHDLGKNIDLVINGAEAELDKSMVEKINDPLMHLVRNAIDHGIESPEERIAKGKSPAALLSLNAYHDSGSIVIEVSDDGKGLDRQKILDAAVRKGIVKEDQEITEEEIDHLIFDAGFSTADMVTELSGRGVGLDVVKRNINALNGTIDVHSEEDVGTTFQIFLPLTLAIIDGFLLNVGASSFVVPLDRVVECVEFEEDELQVTQTGYLNLRGKVLPLLRLHDLFGIEYSGADSRTQRENIVVVRYANQQAGLVVDELMGEFQAVIKPLGKIFEKLSGVSGATILGNGEVALILDIPGLVQKYAGGAGRHHHYEHHPVAQIPAPAP